MLYRYVMRGDGRFEWAGGGRGHGEQYVNANKQNCYSPDLRAQVTANDRERGNGEQHNESRQWVTTRAIRTESDARLKKNRNVDRITSIPVTSCRSHLCRLLLMDHANLSIKRGFKFDRFLTMAIYRTPTMRNRFASNIAISSDNRQTTPDIDLQSKILFVDLAVR